MYTVIKQDFLCYQKRRITFVPGFEWQVLWKQLLRHVWNTNLDLFLKISPLINVSESIVIEGVSNFHLLLRQINKTNHEKSFNDFDNKYKKSYYNN